MVTPELKWPTTNLTPSPTNLLATDTPCLGSETSSPTDELIFWPRMPPAALMSSTACSTPFLSCAPKAALGPVIGPATPSLICGVSGAGEGEAGSQHDAGQPDFLHVSSPLHGWHGTVRRSRLRRMIHACSRRCLPRFAACHPFC